MGGYNSVSSASFTSIWRCANLESGQWVTSLQYRKALGKWKMLLLEIVCFVREKLKQEARRVAGISDSSAKEKEEFPGPKR